MLPIQTGPASQSNGTSSAAFPLRILFEPEGDPDEGSLKWSGMTDLNGQPPGWSPVLYQVELIPQRNGLVLCNCPGDRRRFVE